MLVIFTLYVGDGVDVIYYQMLWACFDNYCQLYLVTTFCQI